MPCSDPLTRHGLGSKVSARAVRELVVAVTEMLQLETAMLGAEVA